MARKIDARLAGNLYYVAKHHKEQCTEQLAIELGVSTKTIRNYKHKLGIEIPPSCVANKENRGRKQIQQLCGTCEKACNENLCSWVKDFTLPEGVEKDKGFIIKCPNYVEG